MLKRYQVLLPDWLEDYIKFLVNKFDLSFSEVIRMEVCISILCMASKIHPEFKFGITPEEISEHIRKNLQQELDQEMKHKLMSKIYFEARKAAEYRLAQEKKKEGKKEKK